MIDGHIAFVRDPDLFFLAGLNNVRWALVIDHTCHRAILIAMQSDGIIRVEPTEIQMGTKRLCDLGDGVLWDALGCQNPGKGLPFSKSDGDWVRQGRGGRIRNDLGASRLGLRFWRRVHEQADSNQETGADQQQRDCGNPQQGSATPYALLLGCPVHTALRCSSFR